MQDFQGGPVRAEVSKHEQPRPPFDTSGRTDPGEFGQPIPGQVLSNDIQVNTVMRTFKNMQAPHQKKVPQPVAQLRANDPSAILRRIAAKIPWGQNMLLMEKVIDRIVAEYALRDIQKPIGVSDYEFTRTLPESLKSSLPTIEENEEELRSELGVL